MFNNKQKVIEISELNNRVKELEDILCPFNQHDFVIIDSCRNSYYSSGEIEHYNVRELQCKRCKKIVIDNDRNGFKYQIK